MWPLRDLSYNRRTHPYGNGYNRTHFSRYRPRKRRSQKNLQRSGCNNKRCCNNWINYKTNNSNRPLVSLLPSLSVCEDMRQNGTFCDAIIVAADQKMFSVHRVIMAVSSDYFLAVFNNPLSSSPCHIHFYYPSDILERFIEYSYSGTSQVNAENVETLLPAAYQYGIVGLVEICCNYLRNNINATNCWGVHELCKTYFCDKVAAEARRYAVNHFMEFFRGKNQFYKIKIDDLINILSDDHLNVTKEEQVFLALDEWINHKLDERRIHASKLLLCVRVNFLEMAFYYGTMMRASYIQSVDVGVLEEMNEGVCRPRFSVWSRAWTGESDVIGGPPPHWPRIPYEIVFAIGGWTAGSPTNCIETYDKRANSWFACRKRDTVSRSYHGMVCVDNLIYMIGGFDGGTHFNTVRCFDPIHGQWSERACMYHARCYVSCVVFDEYIYAIGGYNGRTRMHSVEKYSISNNQWREISPMNTARSDAGAAACNGMIYVVGGFSGQDVLVSAEVYNPINDTWILIAEMNTPRSGVSLINYKDSIYAIGGFNGAQRLRSMEKFTPNSDHEWDQNQPLMLTERSNFSCTILEDFIFVVGGFNGSTTTALTECYNGRAWDPLAAMGTNRSALGICTVTNIPNAATYSLNGRIKRKFFN